MDVYYTASPCSLSLKRLPALTLTLGLELVGGLIIDQLHKVRPLSEVTGSCIVRSLNSRGEVINNN